METTMQGNEEQLPTPTQCIAQILASDEDMRVRNEFLEQQKQQEQQMMVILAKLREEPTPVNLQAYVQRLKKGSENLDSNGIPIWDEDIFIEGIRRFAELCGSRRSNYYDNSLKGLHYPHTFMEQWKRSYSQLPSPLWVGTFKLQCPPGWISEIIGDLRSWTLTYDGNEPLSQALNKLILEPTTVDCGMWNALAIWFGMRYVTGDEWFDRLFRFEKAAFTLTQAWHLRINEERTRGNLLYYFYDRISDESSNTVSRLQTGLQARTVYNHSLYQAKHPGGAARLHNVIQIGSECILFDPLGPNILSLEELDLGFLKAFNDPQTPTDFEELAIYKAHPNYVHPRHKPKTWGDLASEAYVLADYTLTQTEWDASRMKRTEKSRGLCRRFNVERLISSLAKARAVGFDEVSDGEVFRIAKRMKESQFMQTLLSFKRDGTK